MRPTSLIIALLLLNAPVMAGAQKVTPWGDPDLQGVWTNQTPIPLERPDALAGQRFYTAAEAGRVEETALKALLERVAPDVPLSGELNEIWLEAQNGKVPPRRSTSLVVDPPTERSPTRRKAEGGGAAHRNSGTPLAADRPEDRAQSERCLTTDGLLIPNPFYNNYHQIIQAPGYVVILTEMMHEVRVIPIGERPHVGAGVRMWLGDSRGRWEGRTLVVETTNFNERRLFRGATDQLRLEERFTRLDAETIDYRLTVTDPATFSQPWTLENALRKGAGELYEVACHEGNVGLKGILAGARAEEQR